MVTAGLRLVPRTRVTNIGNQCLSDACQDHDNKIFLSTLTFLLFVTKTWKISKHDGLRVYGPSNAGLNFPPHSMNNTHFSWSSKDLTVTFSSFEHFSCCPWGLKLMFEGINYDPSVFVSKWNNLTLVCQISHVYHQPNISYMELLQACWIFFNKAVSVSDNIDECGKES